MRNYFGSNLKTSDLFFDALTKIFIQFDQIVYNTTVGLKSFY